MITWTPGISTGAALVLLVAALATASGLAWLEWHRPGPTSRSRVVAAIVAVLSLFVLLLAPTRRTHDASAVVTLRTPGAHGLARGPAFAIGSDARTASAIPDLAWLLRHRPDIGRVIVTGWGLDETEWPAAAGVPLPVTIEPALVPVPAGITAISWPSTITLGEELVVHGRAESGGDGWLVLSHGGVPLDSARVAGHDASFTLRARPRAPGPWRPTLAFSTGAAPRESLAVDVQPPRPPRVLLLDASPNFESRFLKEWLARQGATVVSRTRLGRARVGVAAINAPVSVSIDSASLDRWDVVMLRATALAALAETERRAIDAAVRRRGLGVVLIADSAIGGAFGSALPKPNGRVPVGATVRPVRLDMDGAPVTAPIPLLRARWQPQLGARTLVRDEAGKAVVLVTSIGLGRVAVSLVDRSAAWTLGGESASYAAFWSRVLGAVRAPMRSGVVWSVASGPIFVDHPVVVSARADSAAVQTSVIGPDGRADTIALARDPTDTAATRGVFRPRASGWHHVGGPDGATVFAYDTARWQAWQARRRNEATLARAVPRAETGSTETRIPVPRWPFFLLFVSAAGWLWKSTSGR